MKHSKEFKEIIITMCDNFYETYYNTIIDNRKQCEINCKNFIETIIRNYDIEKVEQAQPLTHKKHS